MMTLFGIVASLCAFGAPVVALLWIASETKVHLKRLELASKGELHND